MNDYTPLHLAVDLGDLEAVQLLLALGADPNVRTRIDQRETAIELAVSGRHDEILAVLRAHAGGAPSALPSEAPAE